MEKPILPDNIEGLQWFGQDSKVCNESGLVHCARIPAGVTQAQPAPYVVMLHGRGGDETKPWIFKQVLPTGAVAIAPRAPVPGPNGGFAWFPEESLRAPARSLAASLAKLEHFLASLPYLYPVDPTRLVIIGFSQGAYMGNVFALTHPHEVLGLASLAGALPHISDAELAGNSYTGLPVFVAHGVRDEIVPLAEARHLRDVYQRLGADVTYGEYNVGHKLNPQGMKDLKAWVQHRLK